MAHVDHGLPRLISYPGPVHLVVLPGVDTQVLWAQIASRATAHADARVSWPSIVSQSLDEQPLQGLEDFWAWHVGIPPVADLCNATPLWDLPWIGDTGPLPVAPRVWFGDAVHLALGVAPGQLVSALRNPMPYICTAPPPTAMVQTAAVAGAIGSDADQTIILHVVVAW